MSPTSTSSVSSASPSSSSKHAHPGHPGSFTRTAILIVVFVSVGILLFAGAIFLIVRLRRRRRSVASPPLDPFDPDPFASTTNLSLKYMGSHGTPVTDPSHPAARITPFGSPGGETPKFKRTSSSPMRMAQRLPSGAWHFADPRDPFAPAGVTELDIPPSRSSSPTISAMDNSYSRSRSRKEREANASVNTLDKHEIAHPPPAYTATRESLPKELEHGSGDGQGEIPGYGYGKAYTNQMG